MAQIQFSKGINEEQVPEVRLLRSPDGSKRTAIFTFETPKALDRNSTEEITGMYLIDEEGEMVTREVKAKFTNGQPTTLIATLPLNSQGEWDRFMRFMERYGSDNGLEFTKAQ